MNKLLVNKIKSVLSGDINIKIAYLFGSMASNKSRYGSDLDLAVYFKVEPTLNEIGMLNLKLEETSKFKIDLVKLNKLDKSNPVLAYSIINEGIVLINKEPDLLNEYKRSVLLQYLDFKPTNDLINKTFSNRLSNNRFAVFEK